MKPLPRTKVLIRWYLSMSFNPATDCPREDCKIHKYSGIITRVYYPPIYDKYGNNVNPDDIITMYDTIYDMHCYTCDKKW